MKYRRKKVQEVDAIQFAGTNYDDVENFINSHSQKTIAFKRDTNFKLDIQTNKGIITVLPTDYIVVGSSGTFYVVSKNDFEDRFEKCED